MNIFSGNFYNKKPADQKMNTYSTKAIRKYMNEKPSPINYKIFQRTKIQKQWKYY